MKPLKLLVVEDDIPSLELMTEVFTSLKAEVRPVSDGRKAAAMVAEEKFDGIFLDVAVPTLNGFDLARLIRASPLNKSTPIIVITGRDEPDTMRQAFSIGATFFLQKPVDRQRLSILFRAVSGGMLENRRRGTRVPVKTDVVCEVGDRALRGTTWNLSPTGIAVEVDNLRANDKVRLSFRLPLSDEFLEAPGIVVWAKENRQGIRFASVSAHMERSIQRFIVEVEA